MTGTGQDTSAVLFLLGNLHAGGSESKFVRLARRLTSAGKSVHVAYLNPPETLLPKLAGIRVVDLQRKGKWSLGAYRRLANYAVRNTIRSIVCVNFYPLVYAVPFAVLRPTAGIRLIVSINTSEFPSARERAFMRIYAPLIRRCHRIVFGSARQQTDWIRRYNLPERRSRVIYNGVDGAFFDRCAVPESRECIRQELNIPADAHVIVCVARLRPEKAHGNLLAAIGALADTGGKSPHLLLVGDGPEKDNIISRATRLGILDRVHMVGLADDVRPFIKASDIFALSSTAETFSNAALEAAAMGLPVVTSDAGGASEMFPAGSHGTVYPAEDVQSLTAALAGHGEELRKGTFDHAGMRDDVLRRFSTSSMDGAWTDAIWEMAT